jgi:ADP-ribose pyrophosphatase
MISEMVYPVRLNSNASALPNLPGPTIAMLGLAAMAGSISGCFHRGQNSLSLTRRPGILVDNRIGNTKAFAYIVDMPKSSAPKTKARVLSSVEVYRGPAFWVTTDQVLEPSGIRGRRDIVRHTGSVVILAVDETRAEPRVLLVNQYRHAAQQYLWELCAGRIDKGENELTGAKRELLEETGYTAARWKRILKFYASPGFVAETMSIYLATRLTAGTAQPEEDEVIELKFFPLGTAVSMVMTGRIQDSKTISGILWLSQKYGAKKRRK